MLTSVPDDQREPLQAALEGLCAQGLTVSTSKSFAVQLREVLESLGNELMVDITLDETTSA